MQGVQIMLIVSVLLFVSLMFEDVRLNTTFISIYYGSVLVKDEHSQVFLNLSDNYRNIAILLTA